MAFVKKVVAMKNKSCPASALGPVFKVLSEPNRLRILCSLGTECRPVTDIIHATALPQTNVSFHLRILREAGLVRAERRGVFIYYCLPDPELLAILQSLQTWVTTHAPSTHPQIQEGLVDQSDSLTKRRASSCG